MKQLLARVWPVLRLRTIMFLVLLTVAALPGVAAIMLRVYENALVRGTEAELIAQSSALAASAALTWRSVNKDHQASTPVNATNDAASAPSVDLGYSTVLSERPAPRAVRDRPDAQSQRMAATMAPVIAETRLSTFATILLLDSHGIALNGRDAGFSFAALPEVRTALGGGSMTVLRHNGAYKHPWPLEWISRGTDLRLHHARPILAEGRVVGVVLASRSPRALFRGMWEDRGKIAAGTSAIFLILVAVTIVLGRTIVRPIEALSEATRALAEGRRAQPPKPTLRVREIDGLIRDFGTMAAAIELRSHYLRDFAAALTHEFKTPLSGLTGAIELMQDHGAEMTDTQRAGFLANMATDADRLNRLISRLMELAKADLLQTQERQACDAGKIICCLADRLGTGSVRIEHDLPHARPSLAIDAQALETVLTTLIDNAVQAGSSRILITARRLQTAMKITVHDDGPGVSSHDADRIFEPFFTNKRALGGTGLGLAIARALVVAHRGSLMLGPSASGACFSIVLPICA